MKGRVFLCLAALAAALPLAAEEVPARSSALTLDPEIYAEALKAVQGGAPAAEAANETSLPTVPGVEDWQAAMRDAGTELADVRLLVLLQRLNPQESPAARAEDYAAALRLHHLMLAGNARACLELARACREGCFESGLLFLRSEALAVVLERRSALFQLPAPSAGVERSAAPADRQDGASL